MNMKIYLAATSIILAVAAGSAAAAEGDCKRLEGLAHTMQYGRMACMQDRQSETCMHYSTHKEELQKQFDAEFNALTPAVRNRCAIVGGIL